MRHPAWLLIGMGAVIVGIGLLWLLGPAIPWLGRLPGDIRIEHENFRFYFPLTTCLLLSAALTAIGWVIRHFLR